MVCHSARLPERGDQPMSRLLYIENKTTQRDKQGVISQVQFLGYSPQIWGFFLNKYIAAFTRLGLVFVMTIECKILVTDSPQSRVKFAPLVLITPEAPPPTVYKWFISLIDTHLGRFDENLINLWTQSDVITSFIFKSIKVSSLNFPQITRLEAEPTWLIKGRHFVYLVGWLNLKTRR